MEIFVSDSLWNLQPPLLNTYAASMCPANPERYGDPVLPVTAINFQSSSHILDVSPLREKVLKFI